MGSPDAIEKFEFKTMFNKHGGRAIYLMSDGQIPIHELNKLFKNKFLLARREGSSHERWTGPDRGLKT